MARYDPGWVARFYDDYRDKEWHRWEGSPADEVKLHVHRFYLEQYVKPGDRVLEVGAGAGRFTQILAELGARTLVAACTHRCHMFRSSELRALLGDAGAKVVALSASNCLSAAWGDRLAEVRTDQAKWQELLKMEIDACRQPGCLELGSHIIAVARKS